MIFVDSNVLIDVFDRDPNWYDWSFGALRESAVLHKLVVSQVVVAEVGPRYSDLMQFRVAISAIDISIEAMSDEAAYAAGAAFRRYLSQRQRGAESRKSVIADFLIGGQAETAKAGILTRDTRLYAGYFPTVDLICPSKEY